MKRLAYQVIECMNYTEYGTVKFIHDEREACVGELGAVLKEAVKMFEDEILAEEAPVDPQLKAHASMVAERVGGKKKTR